MMRMGSSDMGDPFNDQTGGNLAFTESDRISLSKLTGLKSGTLYPLLIRLNDQGLLTSQWQSVEKPGRPPRHLYRLTPSGLTLARVEAAKEAPVPFVTTPMARPA